MSEQRYDPLQFAEWLKSDNTPNGGADLWAASALYDFQIDPNTGQLSTKPFNEEYSNFFTRRKFSCVKTTYRNSYKNCSSIKRKIINT